MIKFKAIRVDDRATIESYTLRSGLINCDLSFANIFCWRELYHSEWAEVEDFLVIRYWSDSELYYTYPLGEGSVEAIITLLREDAAAHNQCLRIVGLTQQLRSGAMLSDKFAIAQSRDWGDYIYSSQDLRELTGRKFQPKRNHINKFNAQHPEYRFERLSSSHFEECLALERRWCRDHREQVGGYCAECQAIELAFCNYEALGLVGGVIYVDDALVAFTYGSPLSEEVFNTHIEKADVGFESAYPVINRLFAESLPSHYKFIDREEDMGIEGVRKAKLSYHPTEILSKGVGVELSVQMAQCKALWREAFGDGDEFIDHFLVNYLSEERMLAHYEDGKLVSMLHLVPFESSAGRATYIYGVATAQEYRGRGYSTQLLQKALHIVQAQGDDFAFLIPDSESLRGYYSRFGFRGEYRVELSTADGFDFGTGDVERNIAMIYNYSELPAQKNEEPQEPLAILKVTYSERELLHAALHALNANT